MNDRTEDTRAILITGATGNVGLDVIKALGRQDHHLRVFAGVRNVEKDQCILAGYNVQPRWFDFLDSKSFLPAMQQCQTLFLLRPPQIADVDGVFRPLINTARQCGVQQIVFLSVQGVEKNSFIPHHKIEKLIRASEIPYTFLRPAYFMQNFTTTLRNDIVKKNNLFLPAGKARFTLIDTADIGTVAARVLLYPANFINAAFDLTNEEKLSFGQMAATINKVTGKNIRYISPNLIRFYCEKRKENIPPAFILVMIMLHFLPRFQKEPPLTHHVEKITGRKPGSFESFVSRNRALFLDDGG